MTITGIGDILNKLSKVKSLSNGEYQACCPAHEDKNPSLNLKQEGDKILITCQAGCQTEAVMQSIGLQMSDLFIKPHPLVTTKEPQLEFVCAYDYQDEDGKLLYQACRYLTGDPINPKTFKFRRPDGNGGWIKNIDNVQRVLYHLPDILLADSVYLVEGEKDADTLWSWGQPATTSPGGANNWKPEYAEYLKGKKVVIVPDKDTAGFAYAREVALSLEGKAREVSVILLPGDKVRDITDWFDQGGDYELLPGMAQPISVLFEQDKPQYQIQNDAIYWTKPVKDHSLSFRAERVTEERTGAHARVSISYDHQILAWGYLNIERADERTRLANSAHQQLKGEFAKEFTKEDLRRHLDAYCAGLLEANNARYLPSMMSGDDTQEPMKFFLHPYVIEGGGTILFAPPGRGKSYTALLWAVSIDAGVNKYWTVNKTPTLFINLERSRQSLRRRLATVNKALGLPSNRELLTLNARGKSLSQVIPALKQAISEHRVKLIVLDSISRAGFGDLNENRPVNAIVDALSALCDTWLALGHTSRASEEHPYGSIMLDAGADIIIQLNSETKPDGTLGVGWQITKKNDLPAMPQEIKALEFDQYGLYLVREPLDYEFPEIEGKSKKSMEQAVIDFIKDQDTGDATATQIADATGFNRANVSTLLKKSGKICHTRSVGRSEFYGVKEVVNE